MGDTATVTGFLVSASAFITIAGIILATGSRERLSRNSSITLLVSIAFGTALIILALGSFGNPPDSMRNLWILLAIQLITFYIPMCSLISYYYSMSKGENMLSKEDEKEISIKMDSLADEYMKKYIPDATVDQFENLAIAFTYKQTVKLVKLSENLVRSGDRLKHWTIAIAVLTFVMICTTIANIVIVVTQ